MTPDDVWRNNWRIVAPDAAACVDVRSSRRDRRAAARRVRALPPGASVVLRAVAPGAGRRCRRFAAETGLELVSGYLAFPSAGTPAYLVEDSPAPTRIFTESVLATPPGVPIPTVVDACLTIFRRLGGWRLVGPLAPGRVIVGRRA
jgi:hypothetical protein